MAGRATPRCGILVHMYGKGLNSIRWRFTLASALLTGVGVWAREELLGHGEMHWFSWLALVALVAVAVYWMASRLTGLIDALKRSTEALAQGDFDRPVEVECACEVGGLADSFRKMTERLNANVLRMNTLAYSDPVTGLPNRSAVNHLLEYALAPERGTPFEAAIVFIDLDGFKRVNDTIGHDGGDELLRQASRRLLERGLGRTLETIDTCMDAFGNPCRRRPQDVVFARFAGDEFIAVLPGVTSLEPLEALGRSLVSALEEPFRIKGAEVVIGASIGIARTPLDTTSAVELLSFADLAMYSSKEAGRSRHTFFDKRVRERMLNQAAIEADLRTALEGDELVLHFQPKLDAQTLALSGVEALVRWRHPRRGLLQPGEFIEVAERTCQMAALGRRVLTLALAQCRSWLDRGDECSVAVNVSPAQFADQDFVDGVLDALCVSGVPPRLLLIEITESMAMADFEDTARRLAQLRAAGVKVAVDDFGIGFSNLSQLARMPLDELKIDRSLIHDIGRNAKSEAIIRAIVGMTHALGYRTIAEGIETEEQLAFVRELGCHLVQGFLFARPMEPGVLATWKPALTPQRELIALNPA
jgi:two-component system CheB/CheR fusion protein